MPFARQASGLLPQDLPQLRGSHAWGKLAQVLANAWPCCHWDRIVDSRKLHLDGLLLPLLTHWERSTNIERTPLMDLCGLAKGWGYVSYCFLIWDRVCVFTVFSWCFKVWKSLVQDVQALLEHLAESFHSDLSVPKIHGNCNQIIYIACQVDWWFHVMLSFFGSSWFCIAHPWIRSTNSSVWILFEPCTSMCKRHVAWANII